MKKNYPEFIFPIIRRIFDKQSIGETITEIYEAATDIMNQFNKHKPFIEKEWEHLKPSDLEAEYCAEFTDNFKFSK